jgi:large repetitive protein
MNKAVLHSVIVLALLLAVTFTFATPISASEISASKQTDPADVIYYVGDTIYYQMTVTNPVGNSATNTLTRIWDTLPNGTVIEFLYPGSPHGETLVQAPGESHNFTAQYVVAEADIEWIIPPNPANDPYWGVINTFQCTGYDSADDNVSALTQRNSRVIRPDTEVAIGASSLVVAEPGDTVDLLVTESNTGYDPITDVEVTVNDGTSDIAVLDKDTPGMTGDTNANDILDVGETWTWTITDVAVNEDTTFTATGYGLDPLGNSVTYPGYQGERDAVRVTVFEIPPVGGEALPVSRLTILMPWIALGAAILAGAVVFARRRQALG